MTLLLIVTLAVIIVSALTSWVLINARYNDFTSYVGICLAVVVVILATGYTFSLWEWIGSEHKANVINTQFGTNYSREEVFWSENLIQVIHNRKGRECE